MDAWLPEGMSFIRLDVPGGVDFVFSGKGIEKLSQACANSPIVWPRSFAQPSNASTLS